MVRSLLISGATALALAGTFGFIAHADVMDMQRTEGNILDVASENENFSVLVDAIMAAELVDTLSAEGPYTVFAPTNQAFAKIEGEALEALMEDKESLATILTYHVISGELTKQDLIDQVEIETVQGEKLIITETEEGLMVNGAMILMDPIYTSNGVIYVIDTVLMPTMDDL